MRVTGWRLGEKLQSRTKHSLLAELFLAWRKSVFVLLCLLTDQRKPTYLMKGNLLYSKSSNLNVNSPPKKALKEISVIMSGQISR